MTAEQTRADPEVWHLVGLPSGGMHGQVKMTATAADGRIHRHDGRGPWEPFHRDGQPCWYPVSQDDAAENMRDVLTQIRQTVSLPSGLAKAAIRAVESWEHHR